MFWLDSAKRTNENDTNKQRLVHGKICSQKFERQRQIGRHTHAHIKKLSKRDLKIVNLEKKFWTTLNIALLNVENSEFKLLSKKKEAKWMYHFEYQSHLQWCNYSIVATPLISQQSKCLLCKLNIKLHAICCILTCARTVYCVKMQLTAERPPFALSDSIILSQ